MRGHVLGKTFAGYELEEPIGRGGMSEVYRARNPRLGNLVALKLLAPELNEDDVFRERFVRESQIAASLDHPNVIPIFDAGEADGVPYIAMRYIDGPDLSELIKRGDLPLDHIVSIVGQVAGALDAAHERGLIHRDVKPANILIDRYFGLDSAPHVYLSDFGVAKHTLSRSGLTSTGQFVGTIDYVSPEQIEGKPVDSRTDVYSLACVFYECLTRKKPFERDSNVAVMYAHLLEPPPMPSERVEGLPKELDAVVAKAMSKAPDERYATCRELAAAARSVTGVATRMAPAATGTAPAATRHGPCRNRHGPCRHPSSPCRHTHGPCRHRRSSRRDPHRHGRHSSRSRDGLGHRDRRAAAPTAGAPGGTSGPDRQASYRRSLESDPEAGARRRARSRARGRRFRGREGPLRRR